MQLCNFYAVREEWGDAVMSKECSGEADVFQDPEYRERYREKFLEAQRRGMDMVIYPDGTIALIENKVVMHTYGWHGRRRGFERTRGFVSQGKGKERVAGEERDVPVVTEETEYA